MDGDRIRQALARIDSAARRIEQAAARSASPAPADSDLERRHTALRNEAGTALRDLDRLIEAIER